MTIEIPNKYSDSKFTMKTIEKTSECRNGNCMEAISEYNMNYFGRNVINNCSFSEINSHNRSNIALMLARLNSNMIVDSFHKALSEKKIKYSCRILIYRFDNYVASKMVDVVTGLPKKSFIYYGENHDVYNSYGYKELTKIGLDSMNRWGFEGDKQPKNMMMLSDYSYADIEEKIFETIEGIDNDDEEDYEEDINYEDY